MKKYAALIGLAAFALPACTNQNSHSSYSQGQYPEQYYARDEGYNREYGDNKTNADRNDRGEHKEWKDAKLNAMVDHFFQEADTNHDGTITWKEFNTYMHKKFHEMDGNRDGKLTREEVLAMKEREMRDMRELVRQEKEGLRDNGQGDESGDNENPPRYTGRE